MKKTHSNEHTDYLIQSREVARQLGIATETLRVWRREGKGPKRPVKLSPTNVSYWASEVQRYMTNLALASEAASQQWEGGT
jgi:predicted DNA-binding transcriptional regulator AlpA